MWQSRRAAKTTAGDVKYETVAYSALVDSFMRMQKLRLVHSIHLRCINPLESRGNYSATWNNEVGTLTVDGWAVTFSTARRGLGGATARPGPSSLYQM